MATGQSPSEDVIFWITVAALAMIGLALVVVFVSRLALSRIEEEREKRQQAELHNQRELLATSLLSQEKERQRIAADLHDELSSRLNVLRLQLFSFRDRDPESMQQSLGLLDEAINVSRNLSHELYPPLLVEVGFVEALRDFVMPLSQVLELDFRVLHQGRHTRFDPAIELQLFRVAQEVIQNASKHANAKHMTVQVRLTDRSVSLFIADDGVGFDPASITAGGAGLQNIRSRMQLLNGRYRFRKTRPRGTAFLAIIHPSHASNQYHSPGPGR